MRSISCSLGVFLLFSTCNLVAQSAPSVSVTPSSGAGSQQTFSFLISDPAGYAHIQYAQIDINAALSASNACWFYLPQTSNLVYLADNSGNWLPPVTIGVSGTQQNSQCSVNGGTSSVSRSGANWTVNLAITFKPAYAGNQTTWMEAYNGVDSGWLNRGTWTVGTQSVPTVSVTPSSGSGSQKTFSFLISDPSGYADLQYAQIDINTPLSASNACWFYVTQASNLVYLADNSGNWLSPVTIGVPGTQQNSQCSVDAGASSVSKSGVNWTVNLAITFKPAYAGNQTIWMEAYNGLDSGWLNRGTWTVTTSGMDYTITALPTSQTVVAGGGTSYGITLTSVNGFTGQLSLTASGFPTGASGSFNPTPVTLTANGQASSTLNVTTASNTPGGTSSINIQASGSINHNTSVSLTVSTPAQLLSAFISCVGSTATSCTLPALPPGGYYDVTQTILIGHSNVVVSGTSPTSPTILVRDPAFTAPMMQVNSSSPLTGVTIQNFTFCGNGNLPRQLLRTGSGCPPLPQTPPACVNATNACNDLKVDNVDTQTNPVQPFDVGNPSSSVYAGPFSLIIANCDFEDSTGNAISMFATNGKINDVWIHDTAVNYSAITGILIDTNDVDANNVRESDRKICDAWTGSYTWANDPSLFLPRNIRIGDRNTFLGNLQGSIAEGARWIAVRKLVHGRLHN